MDPLVALALTTIDLLVTSFVMGCNWLVKGFRRLRTLAGWIRRLWRRYTKSEGDVEQSTGLLQDPLELQHEVDRLGNVLSQRNATIRQLNRELDQEKADHCETKTRLSAFMGFRLRENNSNIVDLSNNFRPTKLADISSELYDNEWTNAFTVIEETKLSELEIIGLLLDIVMNTYLLCVEHGEKQWLEVTSWIGDGDDRTTRQLRQALKDGRKAKANEHLPNLQMDVSQNLVDSSSNKKMQILLTNDGPVRKYVYACVRLCLHMVVQDPPVVWFCPGWRSKNFELKHHSNHGDSRVGPVVQDMARGRFDAKRFRAFLKAGDIVEFIVWPAMLLNDGGSVLCKGVAQGCAEIP